ncbi:MAG TPA: LLM class F420-dependent oxidoreductase [Acidimicrobiales bacterium]|nr:LLM class F420-dependent oxidoreductase [Acidimicrobiales bacterium]
MARFKVGLHFYQQHTTMAELRKLWQDADRMGVDSIWPWDHFFPIFGDPGGASFEGWSLMAAMAVDTERAHLGMLVTGNPYRNPDLLADMARTVDHLSGGRTILGIGAGWYERDFAQYGYEYGTAASRLKALEASLVRIRARLQRLSPPPVGDMPILVGGSGERVTLRLVAQYADMWNAFGPAPAFAAKNKVLDDWCARVGRDPTEIERTVMIADPREVAQADDYLAAGAQHLILGMGPPFDRRPLEALLEASRAEGA